MAAAVHAESRRLRLFLSERDVPCPRCGYSLLGLTRNRCPECGVHVSESLLRRAVRRRGGLPLIVAMVGIMLLAVLVAPVAVTSGVLVLGLWLFSAHEGASPLSITLMSVGPTIAMAVAARLALGVWATEWEMRMAGLSRPVRWAIALGCWSWLGVGFAASAALVG